MIAYLLKKKRLKKGQYSDISYYCPHNLPLLFLTSLFFYPNKLKNDTNLGKIYLSDKTPFRKSFIFFPVIGHLPRAPGFKHITISTTKSVKKKMFLLWKLLKCDKRNLRPVWDGSRLIFSSGRDGQKCRCDSSPEIPVPRKHQYCTKI